MMGWSGNKFAGLYFRDKGIKALKKNHPLSVNILRGFKVVDYLGVKTASIKPDIKRLEKWADAICKGLWFNDFKIRISRQANVISPDLSISSIQDIELTRPIPLPGLSQIKNKIDDYLDGISYKGANPEIFVYRTKISADKKSIWADMLFYGGIRIIGFTNLN